jgi:hypothetical protein
MFDKVVGVFSAIVIMGVIAVVVSKKSNAAAVISASLNGFSGAVRAAASPVTGK